MWRMAGAHTRLTIHLTITRNRSSAVALVIARLAGRPRLSQLCASQSRYPSIASSHHQLLHRRRSSQLILSFLFRTDLQVLPLSRS